MIMLDSGAFSVWKSGAVIDLDEYIQFCKVHPEIDCYVNLDVIPDKNNDVEAAARLSWENYKRMVRYLPMEKIVPVFHRGESYKWLKKYLDFGMPLLGLGGIADGNVSRRRRWIAELRKTLLCKGRPIVNCHGFGISSWESLANFPWYSVDSTTWMQHAIVWNLLLPKTRAGRWDYKTTPVVLKVSPRAKRVYGKHIENLSPERQKCLDRYLRENGIPLGSFEIIDHFSGRKREAGEYWLDKYKKQLVKTIKQGLLTDSSLRGVFNARLFQKASDAFGIERFYFSAVSNNMLVYKQEFQNMLLSFHTHKDIQRWL